MSESNEQAGPGPESACLQPDLFGGIETGQELLEPRRPEHTAERVARDAERVAAILEAYCADEPIRSICRRHCVSPHTVYALVSRRPDLVATEKQRLRAKVGRIAHLLADRLEASVGMLPIGQIPVAFGIMADKKAMLDGDPGLIVEHRGAWQVTVESVRARVESLRLQASVEPGPVIDLPVDGLQASPAESTSVVDPAERPSSGPASALPALLTADTPGPETPGPPVGPSLPGDPAAVSPAVDPAACAARTVVETRTGDPGGGGPRPPRARPYAMESDG